MAFQSVTYLLQKSDIKFVRFGCHEVGCFHGPEYYDVAIHPLIAHDADGLTGIAASSGQLQAQSISSRFVRSCNTYRAAYAWLMSSYKPASRIMLMKILKAAVRPLRGALRPISIYLHGQPVGQFVLCLLSRRLGS
jgi:hypothetical protein